MQLADFPTLGWALVEGLHVRAKISPVEYISLRENE